MIARDVKYDRTTYVFPAQCGLAALAEYIGDGVETSEQYALLGRAAAHVHTASRRHRPVMTSLTMRTSENQLQIHPCK